MEIETLDEAKKQTEEVYRRLGKSVRSGEITRQERIDSAKVFLDALSEQTKTDVQEWLTTSLMKDKRRVEYFLAGEELPINFSDNHQKEKQLPKGTRINVRRKKAEARRHRDTTWLLPSKSSEKGFQ